MDLDGDGKMEVLVRWNWREGDGLDVFALARRGIKRVLSWGQGD
jgi:hypothetical protein